MDYRQVSHFKHTGRNQIHKHPPKKGKGNLGGKSFQLRAKPPKVDMTDQDAIAMSMFLVLMRGGREG